jgi:uncharacterized protein
MTKPSLATLSADAAAKREQLLAYVGRYESCAVAMSAGVDSTVVAKAAQLALGDQAIAVTGLSASLAEGELDEARRLAELIGIRHQTIQTEEFARDEYVRNAPDRCYHCKTELYEQLAGLADTLGVAVIFNGANWDDAGDYRPGMNAAMEHDVKSPLLECGINKTQVRQIAQSWNLPIWDKPASPCLSSRVAYGEEVTPERLAMIDGAERFLREQGLGVVRVRFHRGDMARIEVPVDAISRFLDADVREELIAKFKSLGFKFVTLDLEGFRSGSQNVVVPLEVLQSGGK